MMTKQQLLVLFSMIWLFINTIACQKNKEKQPHHINQSSNVTQTAQKVVPIHYEFSDERISAIMQNSLDSSHIKSFIQDDFNQKNLESLLKNFYQSKNYQLVWYGHEGILPQGRELMNALQNAHLEGLEPDDYQYSFLQKLQKQVFSKNSVQDENIAHLDIYTTSAYLKYASHLLVGKINPKALTNGGYWIIQPRKKDLVNYLTLALANKEIEKSLLSLNPQNAHYQGLKKTLAQYKILRKYHVETCLTMNHKKEEWSYGDSSKAIAQIKYKLFLFGDLIDTLSYNQGCLDSATVLAIKRFQFRMGLRTTGKIDENTLEKLNQPLESYITQIQLNMERLRWFSDSSALRRLVINVPDFRLRVYEGQDVVMSMKTIVGRVRNPTPIFSSSIQNVVFYPTWTVPPSIALEEVVPKVQRRKGYLSGAGFKIYRRRTRDSVSTDSIDWKNVNWKNLNVTFVQSPGGGNPLGWIKFIFPNSLGIYLHYTADEHLFNRNQRGFSHGCIRAECPEDLATYVLKNTDDWDGCKVVDTKLAYRTEHVNLARNQFLPIYITYYTVWTDKNEMPFFRNDLYGFDKIHLEAFLKKSQPNSLIENELSYNIE